LSNNKSLCNACQKPNSSIILLQIVQEPHPHITDAIQEWIERVALTPVDGREGRLEVCIVELGGTIGLGIQTQFFDDPLVFVHLRKRKFIPNCAGDIESKPFMEALSQFSYRAGNIL
jgi:CTP synthase